MSKRNMTEDEIIDILHSGDLSELWENNVDINYRIESSENDTLLLYAIGEVEDDDCYLELIERGADCSARNDCGENLLISAIFSQSLERVKKVLSIAPDQIDQTDNYGATALFWSIILKQFDIAEYLIEAGADVMIADNENSAPLHVASFVGDLDLVKRLITAGADPNRSTTKGNIPLAIAIQQNHKEVAEYLFPIWLGNHI